MQVDLKGRTPFVTHKSTYNSIMASESTNSCTIKPEPKEIQALPLTTEDPPSQEPDYDFVDQPDQDCYCPVSLELLTQPHQTDCCGHHISQQAAEKLIAKGQPCPMCKEEAFKIQVDKYFKRNTINKLKVYCSHKKSGCEWTGELGDLNQHTSSCPKSSWKCPYCSFQSTYDIGITDHAPQCDYQPVPCPNQCQVETLTRCHAEKHLLTCPLQLVDCEFASAGCDVRVPRKDLAGHMTESAQHHLMTATLLNLRLTTELYQKMEEKDEQIAELKRELMAKIDIKTNDLNTKLKQQTKDLNTKLQQQIKDLDTKLTRNIEAKHQEHMQLAIKLAPTCQLLTLTEFTEHQAESSDGSWYSEPFYNYPGGYQFKLNIDTNGHGSARGNHLTAFLYLFKGDYDDQLHWPVKLEVKLDMLNWENNDHYSVTDIASFNNVKTYTYKCIGSMLKFYPLAKLSKTYLKNNELKFRLWLKVIS